MKTGLINDLKKSFGDNLRSAHDADECVRTGLWNGAANIETLASVACFGALDVQRAVQIARDHDADVSALGGGHDCVGRSARKNGITLDLRSLHQATFNPQTRTITAKGGALVRNALQCLPSDFGLVTGVHKAVGLTGLALGGGYGKLNSRFGLVTDTLQRADVVVADGSLVVASDEDNSDLFWALRGGGKNFGVVTSAEYSVPPLQKALTGTIFFPLSSARQGLRILQSLIDEEGDALSVFSTFAAAPNGEFGLILEPLWTGDEQKGEHYFGLMSREVKATTLSRKWCGYKDVYDDVEDAAWPKGRGYRMDAHNIARLSDDVVSLVVDCAARSPSDKNCLMLHDFHGAAARIPGDATSFPLRRNHFNMQIVASWDTGSREDEEEGRQWINKIRELIGPMSIGGAYPAVLDLDSADRARAFYGGAVEKLRRLKTLYDPSNRFSAEFGLF